MFLKLFKYEFKSQAGLFGILSAAAVLAGIVGGFMMWLFSQNILDMTNSSDNIDNGLRGFVMVAAMMLMIAAMFCIAAYSIAIFILQIVRFYKRHFSDEGYLTFTLPASSHEILLSSILNIAIWNLISLGVVMIAMVLIFLPFFNLFIELNHVFYDEFYVMQTLPDMDAEMLGWLLMQVVQSVCTWFGGLMLPLICMTIGSLIAKKGKVFVGFGLYYGVTMTMSVLTGILGMLGDLGDSFIFGMSQSDTSSSVLSMLLPALLYLGIGIGGYFLMHHLVDKMLNLP